MKAFIASLKQTFQYDISKNGLSFINKFEDPSSHENTISAHRVVHLVFFNLLNNAIQYSYPGTTILLNCYRRNDKYTIKIENIGIWGIRSSPAI